MEKKRQRYSKDDMTAGTEQAGGENRYRTAGTGRPEKIGLGKRERTG
jgi:hypothetical protein